MMGILGEFQKGDGLELPTHEVQKTQKLRPPVWTLVKQKTLQANDLIMESTKSEQLHKDILMWKNDYQVLKSEHNVQLGKIAKMELDKVELQNTIKKYQKMLDSQQIKLNENEKHIIQLECKVKDEEDKNKSLETSIENYKSTTAKNKIAAIKQKEITKTLSVQKKNISVNTEQPLMKDESVWTDECITISKEPFPIFCSKCRAHVNPAPVDQILRTMTAPPPVLVPLLSSPPSSPKQNKASIKSVEYNSIDVLDEKPEILNNKNLNPLINASPMSTVVEPKCSAVAEVDKLVKRIAKLEKSVKSIKNRKLANSSNQNCCSKNIQIVMKYPPEQRKREKCKLKQLKRLKKSHGKKVNNSLSNKWVVENYSKPKRLKVLYPGNKERLKENPTNLHRIGDLFESPVVDSHAKIRSPSPCLSEESLSSLNSNASSRNVEESMDINERCLQDVNMSESVLTETEVLTSQVPLYKYTYPNNVEKDFDENSVNSVHTKENNSTCEQELPVSKECNKNSVEEEVVNEKDISENNSPIVASCEQDISNTKLSEQNSIGNKNQDKELNENNFLLNTRPSSKITSEENVHKDNTEEGLIISEKSKENSFSNILSYPIIFEDSDISKEKLSVCNSINEISNTVTPITDNSISDVSKDEQVNDHTYAREKSNDSRLLIKGEEEATCASPVLTNTKLHVDIQSNNSTPHNIPTSSGIPVTPDNTTISPASNESLQAKTLFMEHDSKRSSDDLTCLPFSLTNENNEEGLCNPQNFNNDRISHYVPCKLPRTKRSLPAISEPRSSMRIRGNTIEVKYKVAVPSFSNIESCHDKSLNTQQSNLVDKQDENFIISTKTFEISPSKDREKYQKQLPAEQNDKTNENPKNVSASNALPCVPTVDSTNDDMKSKVSDEDSSSDELDFKNFYKMPVETKKYEYCNTPCIFDQTERNSSDNTEKNDLSEVKNHSLEEMKEDYPHNVETENSMKIDEKNSEVEKNSPSVIDESNDHSNNVPNENSGKMDQPLNESSNPESFASPSIVECKSSDDETDLTDESCKTPDLEAPTSRNRLKKLSNSVEKNNSAKVNQNLLKRLRNLKRRTKTRVIRPIIWSEPCVSSVRHEMASRLVRSDQITETPVTMLGRPRDSLKRSSSPIKSALISSKPLDVIEPTSIPVKKQRIAHTPKSIDTNQSSKAPMHKELRKSRRINKMPENDNCELFSTILENMSKIDKEKAEFASLQRKKNSSNPFDTVNLTDLLKHNNSDSTMRQPLPTENENNSNVKVEPNNSSSDDNVQLESCTVEVDGGIVDLGDVTCGQTSHATKNDETNVISMLSTKSTPIRELRSRQVVIENKISNAKKEVNKSQKSVSAKKSKKFLNRLPNSINKNNSCLKDTSIVSVLNESIFANVSVNNNMFGSIRQKRAYAEKNENLINEQISILIKDNEWTTEVNKQVVDTLIHKVKDFEILAMNIVEYIAKRLPDDEYEDKLYMPPASPMAKSERKILVLILNIKKECPEFVDRILQGIQFKLFRLPPFFSKFAREKQEQVVERLFRMLVVLNKIQKNREKVRMAIVDAMYFLKLRYTNALDVAIRCWYEVFPKYGHNNDIIVKTIVYIIMTSPDDKQSKLYKVRQLISTYGYPNSGYDENSFVAELLQALTDNVPGVDTAIILICKKMGSDWCLKYIIPGIKHFLISQQRPGPLMYEKLTLLGNILRSFTDLTVLGETIDHLCDLLANLAVCDDFQEGIVSCLASINKFEPKYKQIALVLMKWEAKTELRPVTRSKLILFFKSQNARWWWNFIEENFPLSQETNCDNYLDS